MPGEIPCEILSPPEDCVLTSRKHAVNFYVWHVVIDFPAVPETGKPPPRVRKREAEKKIGAPN